MNVFGDPQDEFLKGLNQEQFLKELEALQKARRDVANDPDAKMIKIPYPYGDYPILDSNKLYEERKKRLKDRTCSRCGYYFKYHIEHSEIKFKPHDVGNLADEDYFYNVEYEIVRETVPNPGKLDDDFYDICKSCQSDIFGRTHNFDRHLNLRQTKDKVLELREDEEIRRRNQFKVIEKIQKRWAKENEIIQAQRLRDAQERAELRIKEAKENIAKQKTHDQSKKEVKG